MRKIISLVINQLSAILLIIMWIVLFAVIIYRYFESNDNSMIEQKQQNISNAAAKGIDLLRNNLSEYNINELTESITSQPTSNMTQVSRQEHQTFNLVDNVFYTPIGQIYALYNSSLHNYNVYLNQAPITNIQNPNIIYAFSLIGGHVVLFFNEPSMNSHYTYTILDITTSTHKLLNEIGNYHKIIDANINQYNNCIQMKFEDSRFYTDDGDYELYQYCSEGIVSKIITVKSDEYYKNKFSTQTAKDIFLSAVNDGCIESNNHFNNLKPDCKSLKKYCYMKSFLKESNNDKYMTYLKNMCNDKQYDY